MQASKVQMITRNNGFVKGLSAATLGAGPAVIHLLVLPLALALASHTAVGVIRVVIHR